MKPHIVALGCATLLFHSFNAPAADTTVGTNVGSAWEGIPKVPKAIVMDPPPSVGGQPNYAMYPVAAGASRGAFTKNYLQDFSLSTTRPRLRSWMGWFTWSDGLPPVGINPGIFNTQSGYGKYAGKGWDYFNFQWPKATGKESGAWNPIRLDQQPLYLTPLVLNYNWAPALFGYESAPLSNFPQNTFYMGGRWQGQNNQTPKRIVRGINISSAIPFFYQYGNRLTDPIPTAWRQSWLYLATRPLETTVVVPSNVEPSILGLSGTSGNIPNKPYVPVKGGQKDPFPYPVWRETSTPRSQTPFAILVDKLGDFHADLIWEATNPRESDYDTYRYQRTPFSKVENQKPVGSGDYLKMTVAQGSPFIWCEMNDSAYAIFYNLIRTNLPFEINNNIGTGAGTILDGPYDVPGTQGVKFVLLYGDHVNPNQWYQEADPWYATLGDSPNDSNLPGGFNPPPLPNYRTKGGTTVPTQGQHNFIYTAIYFRPDQVKAVKLNKNGTGNNGTDAQGNPYFYLEFKNNTGKNWFVIGSVPPMRYYGIQPDMTASGTNNRTKQAVKWAQQMGQYAFNFVTSSKVEYSVNNMYQTDTKYSVTLTNPFTELPNNVRPANAGAMTNKGTILALQPHQYQTLTLGPDYTKPSKTQVKWNPLPPAKNTGLSPVNVANTVGANKNVKNGRDFWDYWTIKGSLKSYALKDGTFTTSYPFQNFLPVMPPPKWERTFEQTGLAAVNITNTGTGYQKITNAPVVTIHTGSNVPGIGAQAKALVDENAGNVMQVDVTSPGSDYPNGLPPDGVTVEIADPPIPPPAGRKATAYPQIGGNELLAVFMKDKGFGYSSIITVTQDDPTQYVDSPIVLPNFDENGNLLAGPATIVESGAGFNFSSTYPIVPTLYSGSGTNAQLQVIRPGTIFQYGRIATGGSSDGRYPSLDANPPHYVNVHVTPPSGTSAAQEATAAFIRIGGAGGTLPITIHDGGLYSGTNGVYAVYTNEAGTESNHLPVVFTGTSPNFTISQIAPGNLAVSSPRSLQFFGGTVVNPASATVYPNLEGLPVVTDKGVYSNTTGVSAHIILDSSGTAGIPIFWEQSGSTFSIRDLGSQVSGYINSPKDVIFSGGSFTHPAKAKVYPTWAIQSVTSGSNLVGGYTDQVQVSFSGTSLSGDPNIEVPVIDFQLSGSARTIEKEDLTVINPGKGLQGEVNFAIEGGLGFDAILDPVIVDGKLTAVRIVRPGSNYLPNIVANIVPEEGATGGGAQVKVTVSGSDRSVTNVEVTNQGSNYNRKPIITLLSKMPPSTRNPDPVFSDNPKGVPSWFKALVESGSIRPNDPFIKANPAEDRLKDFQWAKYLPGTKNTATVKSTPSFVNFNGNPSFTTYSSANRWLATPAPERTLVEQVLYSSVIAQYFVLSTASVSPFGGAFLGATAPDGYGLGGQLGGAAKFVGDIYNMQQKFKTIPPSIPSPYATSIGTTPFVGSGTDRTWEFEIQAKNNPYFTLTGALKTSVQSLQRSLSLLFLDPPSTNNPPNDSPNIWPMAYFSQYDPGVGRIVINPTATQPAWGVNSSTDIPGDINQLPNDPNQHKVGLSKWQNGMLWSGFGVSDQWNDQHYFYGYYLGTAALTGLFDRAWLEKPGGDQGTAPADLWAGKSEMGTGLDQLLMTLAYDPDTPALQDPNTGYYKTSSMTFQKLSFFDQWSGHPWATGGTPGTTVAVLDFAADPFAYWRSFGTDSDKFNGENENSIFEGIQAWSAAILWGGATDRKAIVDLGIYLYSTNLAAADAYFLDKNYNMVDSPLNKTSWVPVTTIDASLVPKNGGNDDLPYPDGQSGPRWPKGTDYGSANPVAYYTAPEAFGDSDGVTISPGQSLTKKAEATLNNFFYAFPTGSRFIQAYPPAPWTMGMVRNTNYMKKWAGTMMQKDWAEARGSALFQPADWMGMAMASALAGVPYNPGDVPFEMTGTTPKPKKVDKYINRLWSSWVTPYDRPGAKASLTPPFLANSVLTFLLALDDYGTPDWTYIGVATSSNGSPDPNSVVFTAAFTKEPQPGDTSVVTTFVAFNPGWNTRYAKFQRLDTTGNPMPDNVINTMTIPSKQTLVTSGTFTIATTQAATVQPVRLRDLLKELRPANRKKKSP
jgi:hypothetical protein